MLPVVNLSQNANQKVAVKQSSQWYRVLSWIQLLRQSAWGLYPNLQPASLNNISLTLLKSGSVKFEVSKNFIAVAVFFYSVFVNIAIVFSQFIVKRTLIITSCCNFNHFIIYPDLLLDLIKFTFGNQPNIMKQCLRVIKVKNIPILPINRNE